jgi:hypothetical protein
MISCYVSDAEPIVSVHMALVTMIYKSGSKFCVEIIRQTIIVLKLYADFRSS